MWWSGSMHFVLFLIIYLQMAAVTDVSEYMCMYSHIRNKDDVICHKANRQTLFFASVIALATSLRKFKF